MPYRHVLSFFIIQLLVISTLAFTPTKWITYTTALDPTLYTNMGSQIETSNKDVILYANYLASTKLEFKIEIINITAQPITLLNTCTYTDASIMSRVNLTLFKNSFLVSFEYSTSSAAWVRFNKSDCTQIQSGFSTKAVAGMYLSTLDAFISHDTTESLIFEPEASQQTLSTFYSVTNFPQKIRYLSLPDQTKIFSFYSDFPKIFVRPSSSLSQLQTNFPNPQFFFLTSGAMCSCFDPTFKFIYIFAGINGLFVFDIVNNAWATGAYSPLVLGVTDCFVDGVTGHLIFIMESSGQTTFQQYNVPTQAFLGNYVNSEIYLSYHRDSNYFTMTSGSNINLYYNSATGPSGYYFQPLNSTYLRCPYQCLKCTDFLTCSSCISGYNLTSGQCLLPTSPPASNTTSPPVSNTTSLPASNTTSPPAPAPGTLPPVIPPSIPSNPMMLSNQTLPFSTEVLEMLMNNSFLRIVNRLPGSRRLFPFFCFLLNIDELWLYQYHERNYGEVMTFFFNQLRTIENEKWKLLGDQKIEEIYTFIGVNREQIEEIIDTKLNYTSPTFLSAEGQGQTFLPACWGFLTFNLLFVLLTYILFRITFRFLFNYRVSIFLRAFSLLMYISPLLLDGNIQYFCFLMFSQSYLGFSLSPKDKSFTATGHLLSFVVLWFSIVSCFLAFYFSKKMSRYLLDNWKAKVKGLISFSLTNTIRIIVQSAIHNFWRWQFSLQLPALFLSDFCFVLFLFLTMKKWRAHKVEYKAWFSLLFAVLRLCLQTILYLQQRQGAVGSASEIYYLFEDMIVVILNLYMIIFYLGMVIQVIEEIIDFFIKSCSEQKQKKEKPTDKTPKKKKSKDKTSKKEPSSNQKEFKQKAKKIYEKESFYSHTFAIEVIHFQGSKQKKVGFSEEREEKKKTQIKTLREKKFHATEAKLKK